MRGGVAVQGDHPWDAMLPRRPGKEPLDGPDVPPSAQEKIDGAARFIYGAIEVDPLAFDLEVSLIDAPRVADRPRIESQQKPGRRCNAPFLRSLQRRVIHSRTPFSGSKSCNRRTLFPKARSAGLNHGTNSQLHRSLP